MRFCTLRALYEQDPLFTSIVENRFRGGGDPGQIHPKNLRKSRFLSFLHVITACWGMQKMRIRDVFQRQNRLELYLKAG